MRLHVDPEFAGLIPPLSSEEYAQLEANIVADGCRDPLVTWNGILLDGHNRKTICEKHGIEYDTVEVELADREAALLWVIDNQKGRRNLTPAARIDLQKTRARILREKAEGNLRQGKPGRRGGSPIQGSEKVSVTHEVAKAAGVSHDTVAKFNKIKQAEQSRALPKGTVDRLKKGETTINAAHSELQLRAKYPWANGKWTIDLLRAFDKNMRAFSEYEQSKLCDNMRQIGNPSRCVRVSNHFASMTKDARADLLRRIEDKDVRVRNKAIAVLAETEPYPEPRAIKVRDHARDIARLAKMFEDDPFNDRIREMASALDVLADDIQRAYRNA